MSKTIDERVVQMKFDNKDFEKNTKTTMGTLQKLRESLKMSDSAKAFDGLAASSVVRRRAYLVGVTLLYDAYL